MTRSPLLILDPVFREHDPGSTCPEHPGRFDACARAIEGIVGVSVLRESPPATVELLHLAHDQDYVAKILQFAGASATLDHETSLSPGSVQAALHAAGAGAFLVEEILARRAPCGFALVRPPGHHAGRASAMGYCVFNNVAVAALAARRAGAARVLVVDVDVHAGNGTEEILSGHPGVLVVSVHQDALFPVETGALAAPRSLDDGGVVNIPMPPLSCDADYELLASRVLRPIARRFAPQLVLVSAGFDAHWRDEQGGMRLSTKGLVALAGALRDVAGELAEGRIAFVLEGGYDLDALEACVHGTVNVLRGAPAPWPGDDRPRVEVEDLVTRLRVLLALDAGR